MEIKRDYYLNQLIQRKHNGLVKIVTGIRRCGKSFLVRTLFKQHLLDSGVADDHIVEMAFDLIENEEYQDPRIFINWALAKISDSADYYFLLDEVQLLGKFESVLNSLADRRNVDVYVTGSNARFLSTDIITEFGGRGDEVHMYPLSFAEFMSVYDGNKYDGWSEYILYGGIPLVVLAATDDQKIAMLGNLFKETYMRDVIRRHKLRNPGELADIMDFLSSSIGSLTNPSKLQKTFRSTKNSRITCSTITKYLEFLEDAFLIEAAKRYDIRGKAYIDTPLKYYYTDLGLRNARINFRQQEVTHSMENAVFNELRMRGYNVDVGNIQVTEKDKNGKRIKKQLEVDFVCNKGSKRYYIQSAYSIEAAEKEKQEIRPFQRIDDSFKKIVITGDNSFKPHYTDAGILILNIYDFLLHPEAIEF